MITEDSSEFVRAAERLANAAEDILHIEYTITDWEEFRDAWQDYVEVAARENPDTISLTDSPEV